MAGDEQRSEVAFDATRGRRKRPDLGSTLAAILAHPLRCKILTIMDTRAVSPNELSAELDHPLSNVSYHVRSLLKLEVIELVDEKQRRGANEHFYRAVQRPEISAEEVEELDPRQRQGIAKEVLQLLMADAGSAMAAATLGRRSDLCLARMPGYVDEKGWKELGAIYDRAIQDVYDVIAATAQRKADDPSIPSFPFSAGLTFWEMPQYEPAVRD